MVRFGLEVLWGLPLSLWVGSVRGTVNLAVNTPVIFTGVIGIPYPEFGVSALRFYMRVLKISRDKPEDGAVKAVDAALEKYWWTLNKYYRTGEWLVGIRIISERENADAYLSDLLERAIKRKPNVKEREKLHKLAARIYSKLIKNCGLPSSGIDSTSVMWYLHDLQLGMCHRVAD